MIPLTEDDDVLLGDIWDGVWTRPEPVVMEPQPTPEQIEIQALKAKVQSMEEGMGDIYLAMADLMSGGTP